MVSDKIFIQLFLLIPFFIYSQTDAQIREINNRNLDINSLKNIWGGLDLNDGDGSSYRNFIDGNYNDNKYLTDVYVYYVSKLFSGAKNGELNFADLSETKRISVVFRQKYRYRHHSLLGGKRMDIFKNTNREY